MTEKKKEKSGAKAGKRNVSADTEMKYHLIDKYRAVVAQRYDYKAIKKEAKLPPNITPDVVESLKHYFLTSLYPEPAVREKLDSAFAELENYVMHPGKVWDLLGNLTSAIFHFGLQFPSALRAGLTALEAYTSAKHFENTLLSAALKNKYTIPLSDEQFYNCMTSIPKKDLQEFIDHVGKLFRAFTDTDLLGKTIAIMGDVITRMKSKPEMYTANEVEAIELGMDIMQKGYDLFISYDDNVKESILQFITDNEKQFLEGLYAKRRA